MLKKVKNLAFLEKSEILAFLSGFLHFWGVKKSVFFSNFLCFLRILAKNYEFQIFVFFPHPSGVFFQGSPPILGVKRGGQKRVKKGSKKGPKTGFFHFFQKIGSVVLFLKNHSRSASSKNPPF